MEVYELVRLIKTIYILFSYFDNNNILFLIQYEKIIYIYIL